MAEIEYDCLKQIIRYAKSEYESGQIPSVDLNEGERSVLVLKYVICVKHLMVICV